MSVAQRGRATHASPRPPMGRSSHSIAACRTVGRGRCHGGATLGPGSSPAPSRPRAPGRGSRPRGAVHRRQGVTIRGRTRTARSSSGRRASRKRRAGSPSRGPQLTDAGARGCPGGACGADGRGVGELLDAWLSPMLAASCPSGWPCLRLSSATPPRAQTAISGLAGAARHAPAGCHSAAPHLTPPSVLDGRGAIHELAHLRVAGHSSRFWALGVRHAPRGGSAREGLRHHHVEVQAALQTEAGGSDPAQAAGVDRAGGQFVQAALARNLSIALEKGWSSPSSGGPRRVACRLVVA